MSKPRNVLPVDPKPLHYTLKLRPNMTDFTFTGHVTVNLEARNPFTQIIFNCIEIAFQSAHLTGPSGYDVVIAGSENTLDELNMRGTIVLPCAAPAGSLTLELAYTGIINDKLHGFYRSKATVGDKVHYICTTQFESTDARRALPCWDEPSLKATFDVIIEVPKETQCVLSNMHEVRRDEVAANADLVAVVFATTPKMSTYLLAWTIGDMEMIHKTIPKTRGGETLIRVFLPRGGNVTQGEFALDCACRVLPLYETFFGSDYLLSKCDLLGIPDFSFGAMENWGLIIYREAALQCDASSSVLHRRWVARIVAHELAHQWFGNLVTMEWWRELWLNEAFATWVEYWATDQLFPHWDIFSQFVSDGTARALTLDGLRSSHAVEVDVVDAREVDEIFDAISYLKGGSIVRQAIEYIGMDAFKVGIQNYLKQFEFRNATTVDLWNYLGAAAGKPELAIVMQDWTGTQGYPVLRVESHADGLIVTQNRFLATGDTTSDEDTALWHVPLRILHEGSTELTPFMLSSRSQVVPFNHSSGWVNINAKQTAFCRVLYTPELLDKLCGAVRKLDIFSINRLSLISDYIAFARSATVSTAEVLKLMQSYQNETEFTVWSAVTTTESDVRSVIVCSMGEEAISMFNKFCIALYEPAMQKVGYTPKQSESDNDAQLRTLLFGRLVAANHPASVVAAKNFFAARGQAPIAADLRSVVYSAVVSYGDVDEFNLIKEASLKETDAMERGRFLTALGSTRNPLLVKQAMEFALSDNVRSQDSLNVFAAVGNNRHAQSLYVEFLISNWAMFWKRLPGLLIGRVLKALDAASNLELVDRLEAFWATVDDTQRVGIDRTFQQAIEAIRNNAKWAARDSAKVGVLLESI